mgnify:CR=1 FL=1
MPFLLHCVMNMQMMQSDLAILVIDENAIRASIIEEGLREAGHCNVVVINEIQGVGRIIESEKLLRSVRVP